MYGIFTIKITFDINLKLNYNIYEKKHIPVNPFLVDAKSFLFE